MYVITIIPYQEPPGNYNPRVAKVYEGINYTIPRTTGELQLLRWCFIYPPYYTIPRTTGELQHIVYIRRIPTQLYHTKNHRGTTTFFD